MIDFYARRCRSCRRRAAVRQRCFRLARRALRAHRFGGCSPAHRGDALLSTRSDARRSTNGTTARLRLLGRELARAQQLPPPRPPRAQTAAPAIFVRQSDTESVAVFSKMRRYDRGISYRSDRRAMHRTRYYHGHTVPIGTVYLSCCMGKSLTWGSHSSGTRRPLNAN